MSVYVDNLQMAFDPKHKWKYKQSCHLFADSEQELIQFGEKIGMKEIWLQRKVPLLHYDLNESKRALAVKHGAIQVDYHTTAEHIRKGRRERVYDLG